MTGPVGVNPWTLPPWPAQQWEQGSKKASGQLDPSGSAPSAEGPDSDLPSPRPACIHSTFRRHSLSVCRRCWPRAGQEAGARPGPFPPWTPGPPGRVQALGSGCRRGVGPGVRLPLLALPMCQVRIRTPG